MEAHRLDPGVRFRSIGDEAVVLCQASAEILVLNGVGSRILHLIEGRLSDEEIVAAIRREFDVVAEVATRDVNDFLSELEEAGVVRQVVSP